MDRKLSFRSKTRWSGQPLWTAQLIADEPRAGDADLNLRWLALGAADAPLAGMAMPRQNYPALPRPTGGSAPTPIGQLLLPGMRAPLEFYWPELTRLAIRQAPLPLQIGLPATTDAVDVDDGAIRLQLRSKRLESLYGALTGTGEDMDLTLRADGVEFTARLPWRGLAIVAPATLCVLGRELALRVSLRDTTNPALMALQAELERAFATLRDPRLRVLPATLPTELYWPLRQLSEGDTHFDWAQEDGEHLIVAPLTATAELAMPGSDGERLARIPAQQLRLHWRDAGRWRLGLQAGVVDGAAQWRLDAEGKQVSLTALLAGDTALPLNLAVSDIAARVEQAWQPLPAALRDSAELPAFTPLEDGWLRWPLPRPRPRPGLDSDYFSPDTGAREDLNALEGSISFRTPINAAALAEQWPLSLTIEACQGARAIWEFDADGKLLSSQLRFWAARLSGRGLLWISLQRPSAEDALPTLDPAAIIDVPVETLPAALESDGWYLRALKLDVDASGRLSLPALDLHRLDAGTELPLMAWRRSPHDAFVSALPLTRSASLCTQPLQSRELAPFRLHGKISLMRADALRLPRLEAAGQAPAWPQLSIGERTGPADDWGDRYTGRSASGIGFASVRHAGIELQPGAGWQQPQYAWRYDLPWLDEMHALAALPPDAQGAAASGDGDLRDGALDDVAMAAHARRRADALALSRVQYAYASKLTALDASAPVADLLPGLSCRFEIKLGSAADGLQLAIDGQPLTPTMALRGLSGRYQVQGTVVALSADPANPILCGNAPATRRVGDWQVDYSGFARQGAEWALYAGSAGPLVRVERVSGRMDLRCDADIWTLDYRQLPFSGDEWRGTAATLDADAWTPAGAARHGHEWRLLSAGPLMLDGWPLWPSTLLRVRRGARSEVDLVCRIGPDLGAGAATVILHFVQGVLTGVTPGAAELILRVRVDSKENRHQRLGLADLAQLSLQPAVAGGKPTLRLTAINIDWLGQPSRLPHGVGNTFASEESGAEASLAKLDIELDELRQLQIKRCALALNRRAAAEGPNVLSAEVAVALDGPQIQTHATLRLLQSTLELTGVELSVRPGRRGMVLRWQAGTAADPLVPGLDLRLNRVRQGALACALGAGGRWTAGYARVRLYQDAGGASSELDIGSADAPGAMALRVSGELGLHGRIAWPAVAWNASSGDLSLDPARAQEPALRVRLREHTFPLKALDTAYRLREPWRVLVACDDDIAGPRMQTLTLIHRQHLAQSQQGLASFPQPPDGVHKRKPSGLGNPKLIEYLLPAPGSGDAAGKELIALGVAHLRVGQPTRVLSWPALASSSPNTPLVKLDNARKVDVSGLDRLQLAVGSDLTATPIVLSSTPDESQLVAACALPLVNVEQDARQPGSNYDDLVPVSGLLALAAGLQPGAHSSLVFDGDRAQPGLRVFRLDPAVAPMASEHRHELVAGGVDGLAISRADQPFPVERQALRNWAAARLRLPAFVVVSTPTGYVDIELGDREVYALSAPLSLQQGGPHPFLDARKGWGISTPAHLEALATAVDGARPLRGPEGSDELPATAHRQARKSWAGTEPVWLEQRHAVAYMPASPGATALPPLPWANPWLPRVRVPTAGQHAAAVADALDAAASLFLLPTSENHLAIAERPGAAYVARALEIVETAPIPLDPALPRFGSRASALGCQYTHYRAPRAGLLPLRRRLGMRDPNGMQRMPNVLMRTGSATLLRSIDDNSGALLHPVDSYGVIDALDSRLRLAVTSLWGPDTPDTAADWLQSLTLAEVAIGSQQLAMQHVLVGDELHLSAVQPGRWAEAMAQQPETAPVSLQLYRHLDVGASHGALRAGIAGAAPERLDLPLLRRRSLSLPPALARRTALFVDPAYEAELGTPAHALLDAERDPLLAVDRRGYALEESLTLAWLGVAKQSIRFQWLPRLGAEPINLVVAGLEARATQPIELVPGVAYQLRLRDLRSGDGSEPQVGDRIRIVVQADPVRALDIDLLARSLLPAPVSLYMALQKRSSAGRAQYSAPMVATAPLPERVLLGDVVAQMRQLYVRRRAAFEWRCGSEPGRSGEDEHWRIIKVDRNGQAELE